jgi:hypothetical protein
LFDPLECEHFSLDESRRNDIPKISTEYNEKIDCVLHRERGQKAIFEMKRNKALGPDGFPVESYQIF